jgi:SET domain-containing protein
MVVSVYVLSETLKKKIRTQYGKDKLICAKCGKPIKAGQEITSHRNHSKSQEGRLRFFHQGCYESMYIDLGD